jgi:CheY-like chemotaxis protein
MFNILIVEDNLDSRRIFCSILEWEGYQVTVADNGADALKKVQKDPPSLILLDLLLPEVDGLQVIQALKKDSRFKAIPIIVISVKTDPESRQESLSMGANNFLVKPVNFSVLLRMIKLYLVDEVI